MSYSKPVACFRDVLLYCDFTESKSQDCPYATYLSKNKSSNVLIDFIEYGLAAKKITSKNFLGDPEGIRELFIRIMTCDNYNKPEGWLKHLKIKHFGRQWRLLGKDIKLIETTDKWLVEHKPRRFDTSKIEREIDFIDRDAMMDGYQRNRLMYGDFFAGVIACAFIGMYFTVEVEDQHKIRFWLENQTRGI